MDQFIFIPSAFIGILFIAIYSYRCHKSNKKFNQAVIVTAILQSSGIVYGLLLILGTVNDEVRKLLNEIDLYILISGLVVVSASLQGLKKDIFLSTKVEVESKKSDSK